MKRVFLTIIRYMNIIFVVIMFEGCSYKSISLNKNPFNDEVPIYGNWCGPNHPNDIYNAEQPIDAFDEACMEHDLCYAKNHYFSCECDDILHEKLLKEYYKDPGVRKFYTGIYFEMNLCQDKNNSIKLSKEHETAPITTKAMVIYPAHLMLWAYALVSLPFAFTVDYISKYIHNNNNNNNIESK